MHRAEAAGLHAENTEAERASGAKYLLKAIFTNYDVLQHNSFQAAIRVDHPIFISSRSDSDRTHRAFHHATTPATKMM